MKIVNFILLIFIVTAFLYPSLVNAKDDSSWLEEEPAVEIPEVESSSQPAEVPSFIEEPETKTEETPPEKVEEKKPEEMPALPLGVPEEKEIKKEIKQEVPVKKIGKKQVKPKPVTAKKTVTASTKEKQHKVIKGDTLWDIADKYYKNPWLWKKIWNINKEIIQNPDLIFPDQVFIIPGLPSYSKEKTKIFVSQKTSIPKIPETKEELLPEEIKTTKSKKLILPEEKQTITQSLEEKEVKTEEKIEAPGELPEEISSAIKEEKPSFEETPVLKETEESTEPSYPAPIKEEKEIETEIEEEQEKTFSTKEEMGKFSAGSFIIPEEFKFDGKIIGAKEKRRMMSQNDEVYINAGKNKNLKPFMKCGIYRDEGKIRNSETGEVAKKVKKIGILKITPEISDSMSTALIIMSHEPIYEGDLILKQ